MADNAPGTEKTDDKAPAPTLEERLNASIDKIEKPAGDEKKDEKPAAKAPAVDDEKEKKKADAVDADADDDDDVDDDEPDKDAKAESGKKADDSGAAEPDEEDEDEDDDDSITPEFKEALAKQRIDFKLLEGLSTKEKNVVFEHAKRLNQAFTRAQMEATAFRKEKAVFETERTYQTKNPDRYIADLLVKEPDLLEKVNKELERRQNPVYAEALEKDRAADKKLAEAEAERSESKAEELQDDIASLEAITSRAAKEAGLPEEFASEAVANAILQRRVDGKDHRLTDAEISAIVGARATIFRKHVGAHKAASTRDAKNKYVKDKAEDAKNTKPNKPKGSSTEKKKVAAGPAPENVADFTSRWLESQGM